MDRGWGGGGSGPSTPRGENDRPVTPRGVDSYPSGGSGRRALTPRGESRPSSQCSNRPATPRGAESRPSSTGSNRPATPRGQPSPTLPNDDEPAASTSDVKQVSNDTNGLKRSRSPSPSNAPPPSTATRKRFRYESPGRENPGPCLPIYEPVSSHTTWRSTVQDQINPKSFEEVAALGREGHSVQLDSWLDKETGLVRTADGYLIHFHINHMWEMVNKTYWTEMREIYSSVEMQQRFQIGAKLRCQYRKNTLGKLCRSKVGTNNPYER